MPLRAKKRMTTEEDEHAAQGAEEEEEWLGEEEEVRGEEEEEGSHLVVAAAAIGEDFNAAESQEDVRSSRREQFLTRFWCQGQIPTQKLEAVHNSLQTLEHLVSSPEEQEEGAVHNRQRQRTSHRSQIPTEV